MSQNGYEIEERNWPKRTFLIQRAIVAFDQLPAFFGKAYGTIYSIIEKYGIRAIEPPCAIYYAIDEEKKETDLAAAVPVQSPLPEIADLARLELPPSRVLTAIHYGPYDTMAPAYASMEKYMAVHGLQKSLIIEEYFSDPQKETDAAKWKTAIHFIVS